MTALEIRPEEIGTYDYEEVKRRRARMFGKPQGRPGDVLFPQKSRPARPGDVLFPQKPRPSVTAPEAAPAGCDVPIESHITPRDWLIQSRYIVPTPEPITFPPRRYPAIRDIIVIVARVYDIEINCLKSSRRAAAVVRPRQEAMWLAKKFTPLSLPEIGRQFGGRDHTTVLHAIRKIEAMVNENVYDPMALPFIQALAEDLKAKFDAYIQTLPDPVPPPPPPPLPVPGAPKRLTSPWSEAEKEAARTLLADRWPRRIVAEKLNRSFASLGHAIYRYQLHQPARREG